ncbi:MAG: CapA family protein, partial [Lachnospiraceae bacterium]|nr:CapA family protein [Lachnospiraceae bacterium]
MKKQVVVILIEAVILLSLILGYMFFKENQSKNPSYDDVVTDAVFEVPAEMEPASENITVEEETLHASLTCVGDIMMHSWQINRGYDAATDTFDYMESFTYVEDYLNEADFTFGNLETTLAGRYNGANSDVHGYADYPMFNSPEVLADNLKELG